MLAFIVARSVAGWTNRFRMLVQTAEESSDTLIAFALGAEGQAPDEPVRVTRAPARRGPPPRRLTDEELRAPGPALPEGPGKAVVARLCTACHGTGVFARLRMGRVGWEDQVSAMKERGAAWGNGEFEVVVDYLVRNFGN